MPSTVVRLPRQSSNSLCFTSFNDLKNTAKQKTIRCCLPINKHGLNHDKKNHFFGHPSFTRRRRRRLRRRLISTSSSSSPVCSISGSSLSPHTYLNSVA
ncbi:hypothetical protein LWI28_027799 [Acer negundo]|uniref:Uncharacterized protein n=1 Tax=Acer negundo TaxID=4023 RepID=A0AAD5P6G5_ACENE|nr:hypothetical protein LWI28_027799 [Acer negundo]